jgi:TonB family protein
VRPDDLLDRFRIDPSAPGPVDDPRPEPVVVAGGTGPPEPPSPIRLDPSRATAEPERTPRIVRRAGWPLLGLIASILIHLLPLLALLDWTVTPAELPKPIPVQLVIEQPPPPPPQQKPPELRAPPRARLASIDIGEPASQPEQPKTETAPIPNEPAETDTAAAPEPMPKPAPTPEPVAVPPPEFKPEPKPPEPKRPPKRTVAARLAPNPHPPARSTHVPGPAATRDEYLAYCATLISRYFDMLPPAFLSGRSGVAVLSIVVLDDGTIARVAVKRSSGYRDIDSRAEQMIATVRRFPPLPQWIQDPSMLLDVNVAFRDGLLVH